MQDTLIVLLKPVRRVFLPRVRSYLPVVFLLSWGGLGQGMGQDRVPAAARSIYQAHQDALVVVTAQVVLKFETKEGGALPEQRQNAQTLGAIVDKRGLVILSNSAIDLSLGMVGQRGRAVGSDVFLEVSGATTVFEAIQVNLADSAVFHALLIDRRPELDLAFLLLDEAEVARRGSALPSLELGESGEGVSIGEQVIGLARSSSVYGYIPTVVPMYISAISKRDPTFYITTVGSAQGMPVFNLGGKFVGLTLQRIVEGKPTAVLGVLESKAVEQRVKLAKTKHRALR